MILKFEKSFSRDYDRIQDKFLARQILAIIENIKDASTIKDIKEIKKLKGFKNYYRIKTGDYRIGISIKNSIVTFIIFKHRKDIYKKFP